MKILITGSMGFLGNRCLKKFRSEGHDVISTDLHEGADFVGDLCNYEFVKSLPQVDLVVNCSAVQYVTRNKPFLRRNFFHENNVIAAKNLSKHYKEVPHFIHIGTSMMYQMSNSDLSESDKMIGNGIYSNSKCEAQQYIDKIKNSATVIPCIIGGPGREGLFKSFIKMVKYSPVVIVPGDGLKPIHMVGVDDVVNLIYLISETKSFGMFNAGSKDPLSINDWIKIISSRLDKKTPKCVNISVTFLKAVSALTGYRLLAKEQILMLENRHVLSIEKSEKIGWLPEYTNYDVVVQISDFITGRSK